ncbi:hypothetical protein CVT26_004708 [Gymnopilus dilepis]|uniref:Uncharacterized protein n=1 Tax=Gymnopilus dilepis TaxID=231916 RepID=A0A409XZ97_9AGAR|nr:hypothetical protein CVT26_004708 [Gymnopilus dilepis]
MRDGPLLILFSAISSEPGGNWDTSPVQGTGNGTLSCGLKSTSVTFNLTGSATWYMDGEFSASQAILVPKATLSNWVPDPDSHIIKFCESHSLPIVRNVAIAFAGSADVQAQAMLDIATFTNNPGLRLTVNVVNSAIATSTSDDPSSSPCPSDRPVLKKHHKAVGIVSIMAIVLIYLHAHFWKLVVIQLASSIFVAVGWLAFRKHQLQFYADKDVGPVQIAMFLSGDEDIFRSEDISRKRAREHIVAWQVLDIGHSRESSNFLPGKGEPQLGFATVEDVDGPRQAIKPLASAKAPAAWLGDEWEEMEDLDISEGLTNKSDRLHFAYGSLVPLLTFEECLLSSPPTRHFYPINSRDEKYTVNPELYLHIFVSNGYTAGQYGHGIVRNIRGDMLTKRGIKVSSLKPISYWHIYKMNGKIRLKKTREDMIELEEWDNV